MGSRDQLYIVEGYTIEDIKRSLNFSMQRIQDRLDKIEGIRGTASIESDLDMNGNDIINVGECGSSSTSSTSTTRSSKYWSFGSPSGASGTFYFGGFYDWNGSAFTPGSTTVGSANNPYAAHFSLILGADTPDMVVSVKGTSINDEATRTENDTVVLDTSGGKSGDYYETQKKWIGQVTVALIAGSGVTTNVGMSKYWDFGNTAFTVVGLEATWVAGANDSSANIELLHHKTTGWTYNAGGTPTTPTAIAVMGTDHGTEDDLVNGEPGAWKRTDLSQAIDGAASEGTIWRITTGANKSFELGNLELTVTQ
jgi:hypothetical protein